jgi:hypothetical protein
VGLRFVALVFAAVFPIIRPDVCPAQAASTVIPKLTGIVNIPDYKEACLELNNGWYPHPMQLILGEGEQMQSIEVLKIDLTNRSVEVRLLGHPFYHFPALDPALASGTNASRPSINMIGQSNVLIKLDGETDSFDGKRGANEPIIRFEGVNASSAIQLYEAFTKQTVLAHPSLAEPNYSLTMRASARNAAAAGAMIRKALEEKGVKFIPDGAKFVLVVPQTHAAEVHPHVPTTGSPGQTFPEGSINFVAMDIAQVIDFYAILVQRKPIRPDWTLPREVIVFHNQQLLSKAEAAYVLETFFEWSGIRTVNVGESQFKIEHLPEK